MYVHTYTQKKYPRFSISYHCIVSHLPIKLFLFIYLYIFFFTRLGCLRVLDTIMCFLGSLGFFIFSVTITAGLNQTCHGPVAAGYVNIIINLY